LGPEWQHTGNVLGAGDEKILIRTGDKRQILEKGGLATNGLLGAKESVGNRVMCSAAYPKIGGGKDR